MCERSSRVAISVAVSTWSPTSTPRMPTQPSNGARITRCSSASSASRSASSPWLTASCGGAELHLGGRARAHAAPRSRASVARASSSVSRARSSAISSASESSRTSAAPARTQSPEATSIAGHPPGDVGRHRHRPRRPPVADRRDRFVDPRLADRRADHHRQPRRGPPNRGRVAGGARLDRGDGDAGALEEAGGGREVARPDHHRRREDGERRRPPASIASSRRSFGPPVGRARYFLILRSRHAEQRTHADVTKVFARSDVRHVHLSPDLHRLWS